MSLAAEEETAQKDVARALGLASHAERSLHSATAHMIACMRSAGLSDDEIIVAMTALLANAHPHQAVIYRAVASTLETTSIRIPK
jgi:alkylhydroperoxidase/carboxymuconolactone decarboxylase family protein YurZ